MKGITEAISNFSKKLSRFEEAGHKEIRKAVSAEKKLQQQINLSDEEKIEKIRQDFEKYINPLSREIEEDEETLLSALKIFKAAKKAEAGEKASIHQLDFKSPLCRKGDYLYENGLIYLSFWLENFYGEKEWTPYIYKNASGQFFLEFIPLENRAFDYEKKALWKLLASLFGEEKKSGIKAGLSDEKM